MPVQSMTFGYADPSFSRNGSRPKRGHVAWRDPGLIHPGPVVGRENGAMRRLMYARRDLASAAVPQQCHCGDGKAAQHKS
jgi:hypothetical protein